MVSPEVFLQTPLQGENLKYFANRFKELDYVLRITTTSNAKIIGVFGSVGSGKTTFLYAVEERYKNYTGKEDVVFLSVNEVMREEFSKPIGKMNVVLIDGIADLDDRKATEFYNKIYNITNDYGVNVIYADKISRRGEARKTRDWIDSGRELNMNLSEEDTKKLFKERLKKGDGEKLFTDKAIEILVLRAGTNLRNLFSYAEESYILIQKEEGITAEEVKNIIKDVDERKIKNMSDFSRTVLRVLMDRPWLNMDEFTLRMREELGNKKISNRDIYEVLRELSEGGFIISKKQGKERRIATVYELLDMKVEIKSPKWSREIEFGI